MSIADAVRTSINAGRSGMSADRIEDLTKRNFDKVIDGTRDGSGSGGPTSPGSLADYEAKYGDTNAPDPAYDQMAFDQYRRSVRPAQYNRYDPQPSLAQVEGEVLQSIPRLPDGSIGQPERLTYSYYSYRNTPMSQAENLFSVMPRWAQDQFGASAYAMGRYRGEKSAEGLYRDALSVSQELAREGIIISPQEVLMRNIQDGVWPPGEMEGEDDDSGGGPSGGGPGGGGGSTATVRLSSEQQARFFIEQAYRSILGRRPTKDEIDQYVRILREAEMNNPVTQSISGNTAVTQGGYEPQILAEEMAKAEEDYTARGSNQVYNWLIQALVGG